MNYSCTLFCSSVIALLGAMSCDPILTDRPPKGDDFESPLEGMSHDLNAVFVMGDRGRRARPHLQQRRL